MKNKLTHEHLDSELQDSFINTLWPTEMRMDRKIKQNISFEVRNSELHPLLRGAIYRNTNNLSFNISTILTFLRTLSTDES